MLPLSQNVNIDACNYIKIYSPFSHPSITTEKLVWPSLGTTVLDLVWIDYTNASLDS